MIVRINQFGVAHADQASGWPAEGLQGPLGFDWPSQTRAYELLILDHDEQHRPLDEAFRQAQLRQLIGEVLLALTEPQEGIMVRLDGPLGRREINPAIDYLGEVGDQPQVLYRVGPFHKCEPQMPLLGNVSLHAPLPLLTPLCVDPHLGLERSVRLWAVALPQPLVRPSLQLAHPQDPRWPQILPAAGFALSTVHGMHSLHLLTARYGPEDLKQRLTQRLLSSNGSLREGAPPVPTP